MRTRIFEDSGIDAPLPDQISSPHQTVPRTGQGGEGCLNCAKNAGNQHGCSVSVLPGRSSMLDVRGWATTLFEYVPRLFSYVPNRRGAHDAGLPPAPRHGESDDGLRGTPVSRSGGYTAQILTLSEPSPTRTNSVDTGLARICDRTRGRKPIDGALRAIVTAHNFFRARAFVGYANGTNARPLEVIPTATSEPAITAAMHRKRIKRYDWVSQHDRSVQAQCRGRQGSGVSGFSPATPDHFAATGRLYVAQFIGTYLMIIDKCHPLPRPRNLLCHHRSPVKMNNVAEK